MKQSNPQWSPERGGGVPCGGLQAIGALFLVSRATQLSKNTSILATYNFCVVQPEPVIRTVISDQKAVSTNTASAVAWSENWATDQEGKRCRALGVPRSGVRAVYSTNWAYRRKVYPPTSKAIWFTLSSVGSARAGTWGRHSNGLANELSSTYQGTYWIRPASQRRNAVVVRLKSGKTPRKIIHRLLLAIWQQTRSAAWHMTTLILGCWHVVGRSII